MKDRDLFGQDVPFDAKKTPSGYDVGIRLPEGEDGMAGRQCPDTSCNPRYFKFRTGTGQRGSTNMFCPYCKQDGGTQEFATDEQARYAMELLKREALKGLDNMVEGAIADAFGMRPGQRRKSSDGITVSLGPKRSHGGPVRPPAEEKLRRDLKCGRCGLEFAVFGLATWCPDCSKTVFLEVAHAEFEVVRAALDDVENRREKLGERVAARDVENALEDVVSAFEPIVRQMTKQALMERGDPLEEAERKLKKLGNVFQSVSRGRQAANSLLGADLFSALTATEVDTLERHFEARHPVTHNAGVVDKKYLDKSGSQEREGREVDVTTGDVTQAVEFCMRSIEDFNRQLFP